jgi:hypothetical protein
MAYLVPRHSTFARSMALTVGRSHVLPPGRSVRDAPWHNANMLELRPTCENCNRPLAPNATDAMICTYECTFCRDCVDAVLSNVCPNCGGGFERRPVRPAHAWVEGAPPDPFPPSTKVVHKPVDPTAHKALIALIGGRPPSQR